MKNREILNQMSNEELAVILTLRCEYCVNADRDCRNRNCGDALIQWLESEAEE